MISIISKKYLPHNILRSCILYYEENDIFLNIDNEYKKQRDELINKPKVNCKEFMEKICENKFWTFKKLWKGYVFYYSSLKSVI